MKNIISYRLGSCFTGKEIKEWIKFHSENKTSHSKQAKYLQRFLNLKDEKMYKLCKDEYLSSETYGEYFFREEKM